MASSSNSPCRPSCPFSTRHGASIMKRIRFVSALLLSAASGLAYAQGTATPASPTQPAPAPSSPNQPSTAGQPSVGGIRMGETASPVVVRFITTKPADVMTSRLIGTDVYNNQNEKI